ncbi:hypothetical protein QA612_14045 [Evansella sp. AB-P1]|uniref:hypothetical protein n=1 Tax=Evansella sp. AB-P1 TaxID=3037653 RepID=UPI00241FBC5E|nr:hypothetical protein [Evansella sp. AB-P1]MDG5788603.1 hypothetical protein [Evansella sp. AB-P1]
MENQELLCKVCGSNEFSKGKVDGYGSIKALDFAGISSPLIYTFCKECGEVMSLKVEKPESF